MSRQIHIARKDSKPLSRILAVFLLGACASILCFVFIFGNDFFSKKIQNNPKDQYLQLVFVLQKIADTPAIEEPITIPARIMRSDRAESLLHHSDKILVLRTIATELTALGDNKQDFPDAPLFAAYANMALGNYAKARDLLMPYIVEREYQPRYYNILCQILETLDDNITLLLISAEWRTRAPDCLQERIGYEWRARMELLRYSEAKQLMLQSEICLGGRSFVYAAISASAEGQQKEAQRLLNVAKEKEDPKLVENLWNQQLHFINNK